MDRRLTGLDESLRDALDELAGLANAVAQGDLSPVRAYAGLVLDALEHGGKVLFCGNGGSAADAQHLAAEYVVRMEVDRDALAAVALTTDTSVLTAGANDWGFDRVFARQVEAVGRSGDVLVLHSTSGESDNLIAAAAAARSRGVKTVALLARGGGRLRDLVDVAIVLPTDVTSRAQEMQLALGHIVCRFVELALAEGTSADPALAGLLRELRTREKAQTLFYRALAAAAEEAGDAPLAERFNELHADEQHHLSRITARLLELGEPAEDLSDLERPEADLAGWEAEARRREGDEVLGYETALAALGNDTETRAILEEILESERQHREHLGGKWMSA